MAIDGAHLEVLPVQNVQSLSWGTPRGTKPLMFPQYAATRISGGIAPVPDEVAQLRSFKRLLPNWNSYGAKPVSHDAVEAATDLLKRVKGASGPSPDVLAPVATGAIQMEWFGTEAEIEVRANPDKTFTYLRTIGDEHRERHTESLYDVLAAVFLTLSE